MSDHAPKIGDTFTAAIKEIIADAKAMNIPLSKLCKSAGVSRATIARWLAKPPTTIKVAQKLQDQLARAARAAARAAK